MNQSAKRRIAQIAIIVITLLAISSCYFAVGWRGPVVLLVFLAIIVGIVGGIFYFSKFFTDSQWKKLAMISCWIGILMAIASFFLLLLDPRSVNFDLMYLIKTAGIVGLIFLLGSFFGTIVNWKFFQAFRLSKKE